MSYDSPPNFYDLNASQSFVQRSCMNSGPQPSKFQPAKTNSPMSLNQNQISAQRSEPMDQT